MGDPTANARSASGLVLFVALLLVVSGVPALIKSPTPLAVVNVSTAAVLIALGLVTRLKRSALALRLALGVMLVNQVAGIFFSKTRTGFDYLFFAVEVYVVWSQWNALRPPQRSNTGARI
jgi:hypothetical protein